MYIVKDGSEQDWTQIVKLLSFFLVFIEIRTASSNYFKIVYEIQNHQNGDVMSQRKSFSGPMKLTVIEVILISYLTESGILWNMVSKYVHFFISSTHRNSALTQVWLKISIRDSVKLLSKEFDNFNLRKYKR